MRGHTRITRLGAVTLGLLSAGLVASCTGVSDEGPDTDTAADTDTVVDTDTDTDTGDTDAGPQEFVSTAGACEVEVEGLTPVSVRTVGQSGGFKSWDEEGPTTVVLEDQTALDAYAAGWEMELDGQVDFETEVAVAVHVFSFNTCGYGVETQQGYARDGGLHLVLDAADYIWDCDYGCDATGGVVWIVAVDKDTPVTTCVRQIHRCG